jgi:uncharacterized protein (DUF934 family)
MPLLKNGKIVDDVWAFVPDEHDLSPGGCVTVSLSRFLSQEDQLTARNEAVGVRLEPSDDPGLLATHLDRVRLIELNFPKYTDGRAFSQAELLRRRYGYAGELRAVGQVLHDQLAMMVRTGFDAMVLDTVNPEAIYQSAVGEFSEAYQPAADGRLSVFEKRHRAGKQET